MPHSFATYTDASVNAFKFNPRNQEVIEKKREILQSISDHYNSKPASTLFVGFNPMIFGATTQQVYVTSISSDTKKYLDDSGIKYTYISSDDLTSESYKKKFDWVVAVDEYYTFANQEQDQITNINLTSTLAKKLIVTTLRDYKNQDYKDREFSQPLAVHNQSATKLFLEYHNYDFNDKSSWKTSVYELEGTGSVMSGPYNRRSMFFKQLAKFSIDAGARDFYVHKNLMYKSLIKKNYEHVISISF